MSDTRPRSLAEIRAAQTPGKLQSDHAFEAWLAGLDVRTVRLDRLPVSEIELRMLRRQARDSARP